MRPLDVQFLHECFEADFEHGTLTWKQRPVSHFQSEHSAKSWNTRYAGKPALHNLSAGGYRVGSLSGDYGVRAHRVLFAMMTGKDVQGEIDHINGDRLDNRAANLRVVQHSENMRNQRIRSNNKSGVCGVFWCNTASRWSANIKVNGRNKTLGHFDTIDEATRARREAEEKFGFHANHGKACHAA